MSDIPNTLETVIDREIASHREPGTEARPEVQHLKDVAHLATYLAASNYVLTISGQRGQRPRPTGDEDGSFEYVDARETSDDERVDRIFQFAELLIAATKRRARNLRRWR